MVVYYEASIILLLLHSALGELYYLLHSQFAAPRCVVRACAAFKSSIGRVCDRIVGDVCVCVFVCLCVRPLIAPHHNAVSRLVAYSF